MNHAWARVGYQSVWKEFLETSNIQRSTSNFEVDGHFRRWGELVIRVVATSRLDVRGSKFNVPSLSPDSFQSPFQPV
jgi:hypothetical protein